MPEKMAVIGDFRHIAEQAGIQALAVHGRTRACAFRGEAEHDTVSSIKSAVSIPVIANGDITTPEKAVQVLEHTGADAIMIGRAAQGRPWIFREIDAAISGSAAPEPPGAAQLRDTICAHLRGLYAFHGEEGGVRIARKHIGWYCRGRPDAGLFLSEIMRSETADAQLEMVRDYFERAAPVPAAA